MILSRSIQQGLQYTWRYQRVVVLMYLLTLVLATVVAYPLQQLLTSTVGHSLLVNDLIQGFNYTFLNDFKNAYRGSFTPIVNQSILVLALSYLLFSFFTGGYVALFTEQPDRYEAKLFWTNCALFFGRIFRLSLFFLLLQGGLLFGFLSIFYQMTSGFSLFELECEQIIIENFYLLSPIYFIISSILFLWQDLSKIILVQEQKKWTLTAIGSGFRFTLRYFLRSYLLYLLLFCFWLLLVISNYFLSTSVTIIDATTIGYSFLLSQLFVFLRLYLKLWTTSSLVEWYNAVES